jgi:hypothetical protein
MYTPNRNNIEQKASQQRLQEVSRLVGSAAAVLTDWLRQRHEGALRRMPRARRMRSVNATPA